MSKKIAKKPSPEKVAAAKAKVAKKAAKQVALAKLAKPAKANGNGKQPSRIIRIVALKSEATGKQVLVGCTTEGKITDKRLAERHDVTKPFAAWTEVEATGWAAATKVFKAGGGKKVTLAAAKKS